MITELLIGFFLNKITPPDFKPAVKGESVVIYNNVAPQSTTRPTPAKSPKPSPLLKATPTPQPSQSSTSGQIITSGSVLAALNDYRQKNGVGTVSLDTRLQEYAQSRAERLRNLGELDKHAGHKEFMDNDGFGKLGFNAVAENQGWNFKGNANGLIENFYAKSSGHNKNQLSSTYTHVGIGVSGAFTNLVFGGNKRR